MNQDEWTWLRSAKARVDLSGDKVTISAFASEPALTVNASGADFAEALANVKSKVKGSYQAAAAARSLFTKSVERAYHKFVDASGVELATKGINAARKALKGEQVLLEEAKSDLRLIAGDNVELNNRLEMSPDDEDTKKAVTQSDAEMVGAKERLQAVMGRVKVASEALEAEEEKRAKIIHDAKARARLSGDARKYKGFLEIMGAWRDDK